MKWCSSFSLYFNNAIFRYRNPLRFWMKFCSTKFWNRRKITIKLNGRTSIKLNNSCQTKLHALSLISLICKISHCLGMFLHSTIYHWSLRICKDEKLKVTFKRTNINSEGIKRNTLICNAFTKIFSINFTGYPWNYNRFGLKLYLWWAIRKDF